MTPLFSIVTINYNDKVGLRRTIESVLQQEFTDYEHIIIDGGSTDGSVDVIKEYEHRYKPGQLTWVSEPDGGIYPAMNKGIRMAKGSFLNMLNGGDWYEPKALSVIHKYIGSNQTILAFHSTQKYWSLNNNSELKYVFSRQNTPQALNYQTLEHQSFFYHISLHQIYGMYREDFQYASDRAFMCKLFFKNHVSLLQLEEKLVNFITGGRGDTLAGDEDSQITSEFFYSSAKSPDIETLQKKVSKAFIKLIKILLPYGIVRVYQKINSRKNA
jgi:glycosyltransferase involved in cell wall biosynthesis